MSTIYNTSIVRDNLILHYDAANVKSYPGSGAIINNLAPNKNLWSSNCRIEYNFFFI